MRFFNTTGPVVLGEHYCIPPLERIDLEYVLELIRDMEYFTLHAPRQTGKTGYMDRCGADAGHLVIFNRSAKPWEEKIFRRSEEYDGTPVEVWGM